jgi:broad specificity phosphatase PhoE
MRHGATTAGQRYCGSSDVALSEAGWAQMRAAVAGRRWGGILCSPLRRCADFAQELARELALPCAEDARLREMHFGTWEGRSAAELMQRDAEALRRFWEDPLQHPPPGAEPLVEMQARVLAAWRELVAADNTASLLLVTHGGPIRILLAELRGLPLDSALQIEVGHAALFETDAALRAGAA